MNGYELTEDCVHSAVNPRRGSMRLEPSRFPKILFLKYQEKWEKKVCRAQTEPPFQKNHLLKNPGFAPDFTIPRMKNLHNRKENYRFAFRKGWYLYYNLNFGLKIYLVNDWSRIGKLCGPLQTLTDYVRKTILVGQ